MQNAQVSNPKDHLVVSFHNKTGFDFTPELGCMFDGRAINGVSGEPGIKAGETMVLPYHIGHLLATNLAKRVLNTSQGAVDTAGVPTGVPIWSGEALEAEKNKYLTELYSESKPVGLSETDKLMAKVEELRKFVEKNVPQTPVTASEKVAEVGTPTGTFQDKAEVLAELEKRGIKHDKRRTKSELEKLLA